MTHSSTSSSRRWWPIRTLAMAILLGLAVISAIEIWIRHLGALPSFDNTASRWALVRSQLERDTTPQAVALLGASRMQANMSHNALYEVLPGARVYNLSYAGSAPYITLQELAKDEAFQGLVILSVLPHWLVPAFGRNEQSELTRYYDKQWNWARKAETQLGNFFTSLMALRDGHYAFPKIARNLFRFGRPVERPDYVVTGRDRQQYLMFDNVDIKDLRKRVQASALRLGAAAGDDPMPEEVMQKYYEELGGLIEQINARGGEVILVRMPSSGPIRAIEGQYFPRKDFWDRMVAELPASSIHFEDVHEIANIDLPDFSHVAASQRDDFSAYLAREIASVLKQNGSTRFDLEAEQ